jgi:hypothetical protein
MIANGDTDPSLGPHQGNEVVGERRRGLAPPDKKTTTCREEPQFNVNTDGNGSVGHIVNPHQSDSLQMVPNVWAPRKQWSYC